MAYVKKHHFINKATKRNKYNAVKCSHDGYTFDSIKEGDEYLKLRLRLNGGDIKGLQIHPKYPIVIKDKKICNVILDFEYYDCIEKKTYYIDVKAWDKKKKTKKKWRVTTESKLKKKMLEADKGIVVNYI